MIRPIKKYNNKTQYFTKYGYVILYDNDVYLNRHAFTKCIYNDENNCKNYSLISYTFVI